MCGISGIYNFDRLAVSKKDLKLMNSRMKFRGPDDEGYYLSDFFGMCMRRLAIIDLNTGAQPISYQVRDLHIILNGEIYNFLELKEQLISKNYFFKTNSDTEVLLYLYAEYGDNFIEKVNGIFSFAIYDNKEKKLLIYRDRLGVKPLYYYLDRDKFIFSSNLDSLAEINVLNEIDKFSVLSYLFNNYVPGENSIKSKIKKLLPGSLITIKNNKFSVKKYWDVNKIEKNQINNFQDEFENTLIDAINLQSRTDVKIGSFLSGGVDSSVLSYLLRKKISNFETYTTEIIGKDQEDVKFAKKISDELNLQNNLDKIDLIKDFEKHIDELIYFLDEPISDTAIIPTFLLSKLAKEKNTKVIITGAGGDELFGGYFRHYPKQNIKNFFPNLNINFIIFLSSIIKKEFFNIFMKVFNNKVDFLLGSSGANYNLLHNAAINKENFYDSFKMNIEHINKNSLSFNSQKDLLKIDLTNYLPDNVLNLTDKMTMASSVEGRVPFLDHRLIEMVVSQDKNELFGEKIEYSKKILKNIFEKKIKTNIWNRKKEGFNAPSNNWVYKNKKYLLDYFSDSMHPDLGDIIDKKILIKSIININNNNNKNIHSIFSLFLLNKWLVSRNA